MTTAREHCRTCASADTALESFVRGLDVETAHHRAGDDPVRCGYGLHGVCCRLCANGPCRVTPKTPKGICGADADAIVARNLLRAVAAGAGCYLHIVENTALNLRAIGESGGPIKSLAALGRLAGRLETGGDSPHEKALNIANAVLADLYLPRYESMTLVRKLAYSPRYTRWEQLGILPGGAKAEVFDGVVKSSTNLNSDPVDMLMHCLNLGISTGLYGLALTNLMNDIMLGEPVIRPAAVGLHTIDPDCINIMITGHQHSCFTDLQEELASPAALDRARSAGAKGFRLVGCTCVGQDVQLRGEHYQDIFSGHAGNNFTSEAVLATGAIDMVVSEFNCTLPGIEPIADSLHIALLCIDDVAKKANASYERYSYKHRAAVTERVITEALDSYRTRRRQVAISIPSNHGNNDTVTGVSEISLKRFLGNSWKPLVDCIASGVIRGVVGVVGCSSMVSGGHDVLTVDLTRELIERDILVLSAGCSSGALENCGLMSLSAAALAGPSLRQLCEKLGIPPVLNFGPCLAIGRLEMVATELAEYLEVDLPQLPLALSAPQWLEEQALADGCFGLALGLPLHLGKPPFITGSRLVSDILTRDLAEITGGRVILDENPVTAADELERIILEKRTELGLPNPVVVQACECAAASII